MTISPLRFLPRSLSPFSLRAFATSSRTLLEMHPGFVGKCVLAPMVRTGELPTRLLSLRYGADAVWSPEIVDHAIIGTDRIVNAAYNTVDFVKVSHQPNKDDRVIFRLHPGMESGKLIFQIGTSNPKLAVEGARVVAKDVSGIDVNAGCPKHFSIHSGMGAALLKNPDNLVAILTSLVEDIGKPNGVPISVKIRILETKEETLELVRRLCTTGIARITVHCRTTPMRPVEKVIRDHLVEIVSICHEANVQCYANGDVESREHAENLISEFGVDGCMIARAAETNPSCFRAEGILPWKEVAGEYLKAAIDVNNHTSNTKYVLAQLCPGKSLEYKAVNAGKTMGDFCAALDVPRPASLKEEVPVVGRRNSKAVKKARTESQTVKAAGGSGTRMKAVEKKRSERGVGASIPLVEQHEQAAAAAGVCEI